MRVKFLSAGGAVALLVALLLLPTSAQSQVQVSMPDTTASPGDTLDIPVVVGDVTGLGIIGVGLKITYTDTVLTALSVSTEGTITPSGWLVTPNITAGQVNIAMAGTTPLSGSGPLVYIKFVVSSNLPFGGVSPLHFLEVSLNEGGVPASPQDGQVTVPAPLTITTTSLSDGTVGVAYSDTLEATGGVAPYTWAITEGNLPDGLSLDPSTGKISGTPTTPGTFNFTVQVSDSQTPPATATKDLSITILSPGAPIPTLSEWGMIILSLLLLGGAIWMLRRGTVRASLR